MFLALVFVNMAMRRSGHIQYMFIETGTATWPRLNSLEKKWKVGVEPQKSFCVLQVSKWITDDSATLWLLDSLQPLSFPHSEDYFLGDIVYLLKCFLSANEADLKDSGFRRPLNFQHGRFNMSLLVKWPFQLKFTIKKMKLQICKFDYWKIFWCKQSVCAVQQMMLTLCVCVSLHSVCWWSGRSWSGWSPLPARSRGDSRWTGLGETPTTEGDKKQHEVTSVTEEEVEITIRKRRKRGWNKIVDERDGMASSKKEEDEANILRLWVSAGHWRQWTVS